MPLTKVRGSVVSEYASVAEMEAEASLSDGQECKTLGYYAKGDGGHGTYRYDSGSSATVNGGTVINAAGGRFLLLYGDSINIEQFGAVADGVTDNAAQIQAAWDLSSASGGLRIEAGSGVFVVGASLTAKSNLNFKGSGNSTVIKGVFSVATNRILTSSASVLQENITLEGFTIDRRGANAQHGAIFGGVKNFIFRDISIIGPTNPTIACGAVGFSPFSVYADIQSENVVVENIYLEASNNFGIAFGNVKGGSITKVYSKNCYREIIGLEADGGVSSVIEGVTVSDCYLVATQDPQYNFGGSIGPVVFIGSGATGGAIRNCTFKDSIIEVISNITDSAYHGVAVVGGSVNAAEKITLAGLVINTPTGLGINIGAVGSITRDVSLKDITINGAGVATTGGAACVHVRNATGVTLAGLLAAGTTHTYWVEESSASNSNSYYDLYGATPTISASLIVGALSKFSARDVAQFKGGALLIQTSGAVADQGTFTFPLVASSGRAIYRIVGNFGDGDYGSFHIFSGTVQIIYNGSNTLIAAANPDTPGKLNVYLTSNAVSIKNRLGSTRVFALESLSTNF